jgi:hypothetical protein
MISITAPLYDPDGAVTLRPDPDSDLYEGSRRVTRYPTLDGGASIVDHGMSHADRTFRVTVSDVPRWKYDRVQYLLRTYSLVTVTVQDGVYTAVIQDARLRGANMEMTILVKEKQDG